MEKITKDNLQDNLRELRKLDFSPELQELHEFVMESTEFANNWNAYQDPDVKAVIDNYLVQINALAKTESAEPGRTDKKTKPNGDGHLPGDIVQVIKDGDKNIVLTKKQSERIMKSRPKGQSDFEPDEDINFNERIPDEIRFMRRYLSLHDKKKTKDDLLRFINSLHRSILEHKIRKSSPYAKQINYIQGKLVSTYNEMARVVQVQISDRIIAEFKALITSEKVKPAVQLIKRYLSLNGKFGVKEKAKKLIEAMVKANENGKIPKRDQYTSLLDKMHKNLTAYVKNKSQKVLTIERTELNGLNGVLGENEDWAGSMGIEPLELSGVEDSNSEAVNDEAEVMSLHEAKTAIYDTIGLQGKYRDLIGDACKPTHTFIYGPGGSGKSSFALKYAEYLNSLGNKILYVAGEQYKTPTFTELVTRLKINGDKNFVIVRDLNALNPADFDFVVLDSKDSLGIDVENFRELKKVYPEQSFNVSSQGTKSGDFTGSGQWKNEVDTMIYCENGIARTDNEKNRWGGQGEINIFDETDLKQAA